MAQSQAPRAVAKMPPAMSAPRASKSPATRLPACGTSRRTKPLATESLAMTVIATLQSATQRLWNSSIATPAVSASAPEK